MKSWLKSAISGIGIAVLFSAGANAADMRQLTVTEPVHSIGYLPLYVAIHKGYFRDEGIELKVLTIENGSGHTNAVLSGQAFAFIGGPEHNAYATVRGAELRSVVNVVDRGNVYLVAKVGLAPTGTDYASFVKGKTIAMGQVGSTPNSIMRYLLEKWKLDAKKDVSFIETATSATLATMKAGQSQIIVATEPQVTQGIRAGLFSEPFYNVPKELGPYAYSTLNVQLKSIQQDPKTVQKFVNAVVKGLQATYANPTEAAQIARMEFPTMAPDDLKATIDRSFKDQLWSHDGTVSQASWTTAKSVVMDAGLLKKDVPYAGVIDNQFIDKIVAAK